MTRHFLGIELGSTRIKAVLIDESMAVVAQGAYTWANQLVDGYWSYSLDAVWAGLQEAYANLVADFGQPPKIDCIGISAMMHGYLAFSADDQLLVPFRTWRNTTTEQASEQLTRELGFTMPQRWSGSHLFQAVLDGEPHVGSIAYLTTLAGYVHWQLTGQKVLGVGDASGMWPIDSTTHQWDQKRLAIVSSMLASLGCDLDLMAILPRIVDAGHPAGVLTRAGARLLDPTGQLEAGVPFCPPEGDAGTGMVATNAVAPRQGNVSAGTSIFAMIVLERQLVHLHPEIDLITTPAGDPVAMVHCNNGASEIDAWVQIFGEFAARHGVPIDDAQLFGSLFATALEGEADGGGLLAYNYLAGEPVTGLAQGRPLIMRTPDSRLNLPNLMRTLIMTSFCTLSLGMRLLAEEGVEIDSMFAHGGIFTTKTVAQRLLAAALDTSVTVGETASEGGAWGMAVLAAYPGDRPLGDFLQQVVFADAPVVTLAPDPADVAGYATYLEAFEKGLALERSAIEVC